MKFQIGIERQARLLALRIGGADICGLRVEVGPLLDRALDHLFDRLADRFGGWDFVQRLNGNPGGRGKAQGCSQIASDDLFHSQDCLEVILRLGGCAARFQKIRKSGQAILQTGFGGLPHLLRVGQLAREAASWPAASSNW